MEVDHRVKLMKHLTSNTSKVCLTADACSSKIYKGYMEVTGHWVDDSWNMRSAILDFCRFPTPHTGDATCTFFGRGGPVVVLVILGEIHQQGPCH